MRAILPRAIGFGVLAAMLFFAGRDASASDWPFPHISVTIENDTGVAADGIVVFVYPATNFNPITENPPGCGEPSYEYAGYPYDPVTVTWPTACVDPGESVEFMFGVDCADCSVPSVYEHTWMLSGDLMAVGSAFGGYACVDAVCGEDVLGRHVVAKIGEVECGSATTEIPYSDGEPSSWYFIEVSPASEKPGCGTEGATVEFYIDGVLAKQTGRWASNGTGHLDIWTGADFMHLSGFLSCNGDGCFECGSDECYSGINISAYVDDFWCGSTSPAGYLLAGGYYSDLSVLSGDGRAGCGTPGATVRFLIDGHPANETATWRAGFATLGLSTPFPERLWGDLDCDGKISPRDAQGTLRIVLQQQRIWSNGPCPSEGTLFDAGIAGPTGWGDWDCDGDVTSHDVHVILRTVLSGLYSLMECASPGDPVFASS